MITRRQILSGAAAATFASIVAADSEDDHRALIAQKHTPNRIGVSTYSFWQFQHDDLHDIEKCIDLAYEMGFDGVEILHRQMQKTDNSYLQNLKRRAFLHGLDLMGLSTHQTFMTPDADKRQKNIEHTIKCLEIAMRWASAPCACRAAPGAPARILTI